MNNEHIISVPAEIPPYAKIFDEPLASLRAEDEHMQAGYKALGNKITKDITYELEKAVKTETRKFIEREALKIIDELQHNGQVYTIPEIITHLKKLGFSRQVARALYRKWESSLAQDENGKWIIPNN